MSERTGIAWTDHTFNPWWGCVKVSPACDHCYAEKDAKRYKPDMVLWGPGSVRRTFGENHWLAPLAWDRKAADARVRRRVFCASMADVFDNAAPAAERARLWTLIGRTPNLDWLLLTKRISNVKRMFPDHWLKTMPENVWMGISVVNQDEANRDIPKLLEIDAKVRFLSCEPLLGPIDLDPEWLFTESHVHADDCHDDLCALNGDEYSCVGRVESHNAIDWVIVGGESGPKARSMRLEWAVAIRDRCHDTGTNFFMKQGSQATWGADFRDFDLMPDSVRVRQFPGGAA
jgi:protein gp37